MYATGARVQEVIDVTINDFRYNKNAIMRFFYKKIFKLLGK